MDKIFNICIHHKGYFVNGELNKYEGGVVEKFPDCDGDLLSMLSFKSMLEILGYTSSICLWFRRSSDDITKGLRPLKDDIDVLGLVDLCLGFKDIDVYVEHEFTQYIKPQLLLSNTPSSHVSVGEGSKNSEGNEEVSEDNVHDGMETDISDDVNMEVGREHASNMGAKQSIHFDGDKMRSDSDDMRNIYSSSDNEEKVEFPVFSVPYNPKQITFKVGMLFPLLEVFKSVVTDYAVHEYKNIRFSKCENYRVRARCVEGCDWLIYARVLIDKRTAQVKTYVPDHSCARSYQNRNFSAEWIAKNEVGIVRSQLDIKASVFQSQVKEKYALNCSKMKAFRAKRLSLKMVEGDYAEQYAYVRDFAMEIMRINPGSTCIVQTAFMGDQNNVASQREDSHQFQRMYMCLASSKKGFEACRPLIGVDGCHLKGPYGCILLTATAMDPNEKIFPLAVAAVEAETKDSWSWFIQVLISHIGSARRLTFIYDQQKGLVPSLAEVTPESEHRFCVRHLCSNFSKIHKGQQLKDLMWAAAKPTYVRQFEARMDQIKNLSREAWEWLKKLEVRQWSQHAFSTECKCDYVSNNLSEAFNSIILDAREKPIIIMMDTIRANIMEHFRLGKESLSTFKGLICRNPKKKLDKAKEGVGGWITRWAGNDYYEVVGINQQYIVEFWKNTCTCGQWQLRGIPRVHVVCCIFLKGCEAEEYMNWYYNKEAYAACYAPMVYPINGQQMWPQSALPRPLPPVHRRAPGRPKKLRRRDPEESTVPGRLNRHKMQMTCQLCKQVGHNKRTCKKTKEPTSRNDNNALGNNFRATTPSGSNISTVRNAPRRPNTYTPSSTSQGENFVPSQHSQVDSGLQNETNVSSRTRRFTD